MPPEECWGSLRVTARFFVSGTALAAGVFQCLWRESPVASAIPLTGSAGYRNNRQKLPKFGHARRFAQIAVISLCAQTVSSYL